MSLADRLAATEAPEPVHRDRPNHPKGWEPGYEWNGSAGYVTTGPLSDRPKTWDDFIRDAGLDPAEVEVIEPVQVRGWDTTVAKRDEDGARYSEIVRAHYYRLNLRRLAAGDAQDFASLVKLSRATRRKPRTRPERPRRATVVGYADPQTGKVASRGGTPELLERVQASLGLLGDYCDEMKSDVAYLLDAGDAIEGFENVAAQMHTNDLSLPRQIEVATDILFEFTDLLASKHDAVTVAGVGSNHCRWRKGKEAVGLPGDDWGLHMLRQMQKALAMNAAYDHVSVVWPGDHDETLALDVCGTIVGLAHGHQVGRPERIPDWWAKQTHGGQNIAHASILVTGHFHSFQTQATGRDPWHNREKRWFQCPTLDNGSDWYRATSGADSDPGLLVFTVDENGWDNLRVLRP
jgi:hypothetical protein